VRFEPDVLTRAVLGMTDQRPPGEQMAERFLQQNPPLWAGWLDAAQASRLEASLSGETPEAHAGFFIQWSGAEFVNRHLAKAVKAWGDGFRRAGDVLLVSVLLPVE